MTSFNKYILIFLTFTFIMSCSESLPELNIDPNRSTYAEPKTVLSTAQGYMGWTIDGQWNVRSAIWGQYWTWGPGVAIGNIERYVSDGTDYDNGWVRMYTGALADLDYVANSESKSHAGIAKILKAYNFQLLVDHFGDIPFSEALKGGSSSVFSPNYDEDSEVYSKLIPLIDEGLADLSSGVGSEDFIYGGNVAKWNKFANSLKLKILMRQSNVKDVSTEVKALISSGTFIEAASDLAAIPFNGTSGSENPMYASFERSLSLFYIASNSSLLYLQETNDPRLSAFYNVAEKTGSFKGIDQGSIDNEPFTNTVEDYSRGSSYAYANDNEVILMSPWEIWFLRAEAAARYGTSDDTESAFNNAILASFNHLGLTSSEAADFASTLNYGSASNSGKIALIAAQKWVSMNGLQEDEGWLESRRMNTPDSPVFHDPVSGLFKKPTLSTYSAGDHPSIWLYPQNEISLNGNSPNQRTLFDRVFWDN
ncbi:MAG: SusD/RagB family nutrient-binding outer membrane lipoprotein [Saprospiraceae bacterium]